MSESKLKPCPSCGNKVNQFIFMGDEPNPKWQRFTADCECDAEYEYRNSYEHEPERSVLATEYWNSLRRPLVDALRTERERCAELENRPHDEVLLNDMNLMAKSYDELMRVAEVMRDILDDCIPSSDTSLTYGEIEKAQQAFDALKQKAGGQ